MAIFLCVMAFYIPFGFVSSGNKTIMKNTPFSYLRASLTQSLLLILYLTFSQHIQSLRLRHDDDDCRKPQADSFALFTRVLLTDRYDTVRIHFHFFFFAVTNKVRKLGRLPKLVKFVRVARMLSCFAFSAARLCLEA